jgi:hypothetical protein
MLCGTKDPEIDAGYFDRWFYFIRWKEACKSFRCGGDRLIVIG